MSFLGSVAALPQMAMNLINSHTKSHATANASLTKAGPKAAATSTSGTATSTASQATTGIGSTFLNLLVQELQNQDPTAPMDSTQMVGQMISLNQLDQLISINAALNPTTTTTSTKSVVGGVTANAAGANSAATLASQQALLANALGSPSSIMSQLSPNATLNAAAQSASNGGALNLSNFNSMFGGNK